MSVTIRNTVRTFALPLLSAAVLGGAALGLAGTAAAEVSWDNNGGMVATPDTYADPATTVVPWASLNAPTVIVPHVDNTVIQDR
jgi:hypothetical protein